MLRRGGPARRGGAVRQAAAHVHLHGGAAAQRGHHGGPPPRRARLPPGPVDHGARRHPHLHLVVRRPRRRLLEHGRHRARRPPRAPRRRLLAERFLEYPDDPASGPEKKERGGCSGGDVSTTAGQPKTAADDARAKVVTTGIQGHFFPYGGGTNMCPGRFFAKQEMMASLAVLLRSFDMEALDPVEARKTGPDERYFPVGALPPDRPVAVRIRRRLL